MPAYVIIKKETPIGPDPSEPSEPTGTSGPTQPLIETYTNLNYIQSTGTDGAYIDTNVIGASNQSFILNVETGTNANEVLMGFYNTNKSTEHWILQASNGQMGVEITDATWRAIGNLTSGQMEVNFNRNNSYYLTGGTETIKSNNFSNPNELHWYLFTYTVNGEIRKSINCRIYSCIIYEGSTKIREFKPVKRDRDNVIGMLDTVNNKFYTSANSSIFKGD